MKGHQGPNPARVTVHVFLLGFSRACYPPTRYSLTGGKTCPATWTHRCVSLTQSSLKQHLVFLKGTFKCIVTPYSVLPISTDPKIT